MREDALPLILFTALLILIVFLTDRYDSKEN